MIRDANHEPANVTKNTITDLEAGPMPQKQKHDRKREKTTTCDFLGNFPILMVLFGIAVVSVVLHQEGSRRRLTQQWWFERMEIDDNSFANLDDGINRVNGRDVGTAGDGSLTEGELADMFIGSGNRQDWPAGLEPLETHVAGDPTYWEDDNYVYLKAKNQTKFKGETLMAEIHREFGLNTGSSPKETGSSPKEKDCWESFVGFFEGSKPSNDDDTSTGNTYPEWSDGNDAELSEGEWNYIAEQIAEQATN